MAGQPRTPRGHPQDSPGSGPCGGTTRSTADHAAATSSHAPPSSRPLAAPAPRQRDRSAFQPGYRRQPFRGRRSLGRADQPGCHQHIEQVQGVVDRGGLQVRRGTASPARRPWSTTPGVPPSVVTWQKQGCCGRTHRRHPRDHPGRPGHAAQPRRQRHRHRPAARRQPRHPLQPHPRPARTRPHPQPAPHRRG
jgi:hypothetical protein